LKKFIDPKSSKFFNEEKLRKERTEGQDTEFNTQKLPQNKKELLKEQIKTSIEQRITRSMAKHNRTTICPSLSDN
jgi:hypothetical protein